MSILPGLGGFLFGNSFGISFVTSTGATAVGAGTVTGTLTGYNHPGGSVAIVVNSIDATNDTLPTLTITVNGVSATSVVNQGDVNPGDGNQIGTHIYRAFAVPPGSGNIVVTASKTMSQGYVITAYAMNGVSTVNTNNSNATATPGVTQPLTTTTAPTIIIAGGIFNVNSTITGTNLTTSFDINPVALRRTFAGYAIERATVAAKAYTLTSGGAATRNSAAVAAFA